MNHLFPPLLPREPLVGPVLVLAAHPDDEVIGCGGMLAWHARQGHDVTVIHATDGAQGDPDAKEDDIRAVRRREGIEGVRRLGIDPERLRHWDMPDGELPEHREDLTARLRALFTEIAPKTLYGFYFNEAHRDHRAMAHATADAADALPPDCRCLLFGVNQVPSGGSLFDVSDTHEVKRHAARAHASQLVYIDFAQMSIHRDKAATVNVPGGQLEFGELYGDVSPTELRKVRDLADPLYRLLLKDLPESEA